MKRKIIAVLLFFSFAVTAVGTELKVGAANGNLTPKKTTPLWGQFELRLASQTKTPLEINACAIEACDEGKTADSAILVSLDTVGVPSEFAQKAREKAAAIDSTIDPEKIILFATHTHDGPTLYIGSELPKRDDIEDYEDTIEDLSTRVAETVVAAWQARVPAEFSWGLEQIVLGQSRRVCYFDGTAKMYGETNNPNFSHYENPSDPDIGFLFFWDKEGKLISMIVNAACPSQIVEGLSVYCADYWNPTRTALKKRFGDQLVVVPINAPAGDDCPRPQYRGNALKRMLALRYPDTEDFNESLMLEFARRIDRAADDAYQCAVQDRTSEVPFIHRFETLDLPMRKVTDAEYNEAQQKCDEFAKKLQENPDLTASEVAFMGTGWYKNVVELYKSQQNGAEQAFRAPIHVIRIGDAALATDQFELFNDYSMRIKARSPATVTFVMDMADGEGHYLPTTKAVSGGGYSAVIESAPVSPEGGQVLVEKTLEQIGEIF